MNLDASKLIVWTVSDFVAVVNQTLDFSFPGQTVIIGEVANFKLSRNLWVYFDLKDEFSSVRCFGSVYSLNTVIEDGMIVHVSGAPRMHPQFGFSFNFESLIPKGEGSIKRASTLLRSKLQKEGLFEDSRKRLLPYPPKKIGLVTSIESAAYQDFIKIINTRWCGLEIDVVDVKVQGEEAPEQIKKAIEYINNSKNCEVLVITRGGGSSDDLSAFDTEQVVRSVASSRVPTVVAIGHETDLSLAELAADKRGSTPSNAAEILTPDKQQTLELLSELRTKSIRLVEASLSAQADGVKMIINKMQEMLANQISIAREILKHDRKLITSLHPNAVLKRGFAIVMRDGSAVITIGELREGKDATITMQDGSINVKVGSRIIV